jgi:hypothetical protein
VTAITPPVVRGTNTRVPSVASVADGGPSRSVVQRTRSGKRGRACAVGPSPLESRPVVLAVSRLAAEAGTGADGAGGPPGWAAAVAATPATSAIAKEMR